MSLGSGKRSESCCCLVWLTHNIQIYVMAALFRKLTVCCWKTTDFSNQGKLPNQTAGIWK
jgi:hypothetical protein